MTPELKRRAAEWERLHNAGQSYEQIGADFGLTLAMISNACRALIKERDRITGPQHLIAHNAMLGNRSRRWLGYNCRYRSLYEIDALKPSPEEHLLRIVGLGRKSVAEILAARAALPASAPEADVITSNATPQENFAHA